MVQKALLVIAGAALAVLGLIGLLLPVMPGLVLLAAAALCFSAVSPRLRRRIEARLHRHPRYRLALRRWRAGRGLTPWPRLQLAFWLAVRSVLPRAGR